MKNKITDISIPDTKSILESLKIMDRNKCKSLLVLNRNQFISILSIGDIQRAIIKNVDLSLPIKTIIRERVNTGNINDSDDYIKKQMIDNRMEFMPIIDSMNKFDKWVKENY